MGPWETVDARAARIARPVEFEDVSMAIVTFPGGAVGTVVTSLLSPRELSRIRVDTTGGTLEVDHVYGYRDADWSWTPVPDPSTAATLGRDPGLPRTDGSGQPGPVDDADVWAASAGADLPSNHTAQIDQLVDDLLAGRRHDTTLASTRPTMEFIAALYASSIERETVSRGDLTPDSRFYSSLNGGLPADTISARMSTGITSTGVR
jgi:predicted dehydrogenase